MKFRTVIFLLAFSPVFMAGCKSSKEGLTSENKSQSAQGETPTADNVSEQELIRFKELFFTANKEKILGNQDKAAELYKKSLDILPENSAALFELSMLRDFQNRTGEAISLAEKAVKIEPGNKWYLLLLADLYKSNKKYGEAAETYRSLIELNPDIVEYHYELASVHIMNNELKKALKVYDGLEGRYGVTEEIAMEKKNLYTKMNDLESAVGVMKKLIEEYPSNVKYYSMLAKLYQQQNKPDLALETYKKIRELDPDNPFVQLSLVDYYRADGRVEESNEMLKTAFANPQLDIDTKVKILLSYYSATESSNKEMGMALELNEINVKTHPDNPKAHAMYGDFLYRQKKYKEAKEQYLTTIELDKSRYLVWNQLLTIESELQNFEDMKTESEQAMELFPSQPSFYFFNGVANAQLKNCEQAINALEAGKEMVIDNKSLLVQFYANLGDAYYNCEKYNQSYQSYEKALGLNPDNAYVLNNYSYFLSLRGENLERAEEMAKRANELIPNNASYLDTYAWVLYKGNNFAEAKKLMEKALKASGNNNGTLLEHYGDILYKLGEKEKAQQYWKDALEKGSDNDNLEEKVKRGTLNEN